MEKERAEGMSFVVKYGSESVQTGPSQANQAQGPGTATEQGVDPLTE